MKLSERILDLRKQIDEKREKIYEMVMGKPFHESMTLDEQLDWCSDYDILFSEYMRLCIEHSDMMNREKSIERIVRDAIVSYMELYTDASNSDCEHELIDRAEFANEWLEAHGLEKEDLKWSKEEPPCL